eukprot:388159-Rhodomonas_salina.1
MELQNTVDALTRTNSELHTRLRRQMRMMHELNELKSLLNEKDEELLHLKTERDNAIALAREAFSRSR